MEKQLIGVCGDYGCSLCSAWDYEPKDECYACEDLILFSEEVKQFFEKYLPTKKQMKKIRKFEKRRAKESEE